MTQTRQRTTLLAIAAVCALPLVLSYLTYYVWKPGRTMNYGELMDMRSVPVPTQWLAGGARPEALPGKWLLVQVAGGDCQAECERRLYAMRQVRLAMGVKKGMVETLWAVNDAQAPRAQLLMQHPDLILARKPDVWNKVLPQPDGDKVYLVDPTSRLVLRYPSQPDPARMIRDLARLLDVKRM